MLGTGDADLDDGADQAGDEGPEDDVAPALIGIGVGCGGSLPVIFFQVAARTLLDSATPPSDAAVPPSFTRVLIVYSFDK